MNTVKSNPDEPTSDGRHNEPEPVGATLDRHRAQRRKMMALAFAMWCVNASLLVLCAFGRTTPLAVAMLYFASGLAFLGVVFVLSELRINDRFKNHYLSAPVSVGSTIVHLAFVYMVPEIGGFFLSILFIIFAFGTLRMSVWQAVVTAALTAGLVAIVLVSLEEPISFPSTTSVEKIATWLNLSLTFGCCIGLGAFGNAERADFYQRTLDLQVAKRRIEELAQTDDLTGAYNRRQLMRIIDEEIMRSKRTGAPFSVALIDLDHFKKVNDTYGHAVGDEVLRTFSITAFANIRATDCFGRYGGEEFLLLMPETPVEVAARVLERLRLITSDLDWSAHSTGLRVTLSAGVSALLLDEPSDALLTRADVALYRSKHDGRNRITTA